MTAIGHEKLCDCQCFTRLWELAVKSVTLGFEEYRFE